MFCFKQKTAYDMRISDWSSYVCSSYLSAVSSIDRISGVIQQIDEITTTIAAAVEEQAAATREIARNVTEASRGTTDVTSNIVEVKDGASENGTASRDVLIASEEIYKPAERMREVVQNFIADIKVAGRAAAPDITALTHRSEERGAGNEGVQ